jgi:hypothetical protein
MALPPFLCFCFLSSFHRESDSCAEAEYLRTLCTPEAFAYFKDFAAGGYGSVPDIKVTGERFASFGQSLYKVNLAVVDGEGYVGHAESSC